MRGGNNSRQRRTPDRAKFVDDILEADALIEAELVKLERMLERKEDAALELGKLRELRQACGRIKELIGKIETTGVARAQASQ